MPPAITNCTLVSSSRAARIWWKDGMWSEFNALMLRDNCFCKSCYSPAVEKRIKLTASIPLDTSIRSAKVQNGEVVVRWDDGHISKYAANWLRENAPPDLPQEPEFSPKSWTASIAKSPPRFLHRTLMTDDQALLRFLSAFRDYGVALVRGAPLNENEAVKFANHVACVREIICDRADDDTGDSQKRRAPELAGAALHPHTDCPGYRWPPNVFLSHCLQNDAKGGECVYVDGQAVVEQLRDEHLDYLHFLTTMPTTFRLHSKSAETITTTPPVILDGRENLQIIRHANWSVQPIRMPSFETECYYAAHHALSRLIHDPKNQLVIKARPGDMMVVNNHRVLHGRNAFRPETGERRFQHAYMEADDMLGRIRILRQKSGASS